MKTLDRLARLRPDLVLECKRADDFISRDDREHRGAPLLPAGDISGDLVRKLEPALSKQCRATDRDALPRDRGLDTAAGQILEAFGSRTRAA